jgi:hypothetical protein
MSHKQMMLLICRNLCHIAGCQHRNTNAESAGAMGDTASATIKPPLFCIMGRGEGSALFLFVFFSN